MENEYQEVNPLSELSPLDISLYGYNNIATNSTDEVNINNESNSFIDMKDESGDDDDVVLTPLSDGEDYINIEYIQNQNKIIEEEIKELGKKFVENSGYNLKMKKITVDKIIEKYKDSLIEIVTKQNSLMVICNRCNSAVSKEEVASLIDYNLPLCKKCISKYDVNSYKDFADKPPDIFAKKCSHCNTCKLLWRQIKIYKSEDKIACRQCNYCCLKKHIKDMKQKSENA